ncbi:MAG: apolipoprotein N-acyltransferase [Flavobacteriales bacterium]|nr:apolipoprotein N-acyltransferase [Flavobacteriales bacterium]MCB9449096.1 apolipoprotein N-acyltransferase [Flavobacteriales bacterium]
MQRTSFYHVLLSLLSGVLLGISWPGIGGMPWLLFIAFVPLLIVEEDLSQRRAQGLPARRFFLYAYLTTFMWNLVSTWWIWCVSTGWVTKVISAGTAILLNACFMALVLSLFHVSKRWLGRQRGYICFVIYWLAFEYLHFHWELSYPWLTLGNAWASLPSWVQWYEYTGVGGGSLWVLVMNLLVFGWFRQRFMHKSEKGPRPWLAAVVFAVPLIVSLWMYNHYEEPHSPVDVVVVQPNIDPYREKFSGMTPDEQLHAFISLAQDQMDENVDYIVGPETALPRALDCESLESAQPVLMIRAFLASFPKTKLVTGLSSVRHYPGPDRPTETARPTRNGDGWYDFYNSAMQVGGGDQVQIYHKSKLVLGVEKLPFPRLFNSLQEIIFDLGGTTGSLGTQPDRSVFYSRDSNQTVAPVICWESVYGDYMGEYIRKGASLIFVVTNDGWWGNTPGYHQHMSYARLRAIEFRRSIARSANTGISCFIDQKGVETMATRWWEPTAIRATIQANHKLTVYAIWGDYIFRLASWLAVFLVVATFATRIRNRKLAR